MWVSIFWGCLVFTVGGLNGYRLGWDHGKTAGDAAHRRCHEAAAALDRQLLARIMEHADFGAWEEEL